MARCKRLNPDTKLTYNRRTRAKEKRRRSLNNQGMGPITLSNLGDVLALSSREIQTLNFTYYTDKLIITGYINWPTAQPYCAAEFVKRVCAIKDIL
jgi:hypothetical protein